MPHSRHVTLSLVAVALLLAGFQCPDHGPIRFQEPSEGLLTSVSGPLAIGAIAMKLKIPSDATDLVVTLNGNDITGNFTRNGGLAEGASFISGVREHELAATASLDGELIVATRRFESIRLDLPGECEILNAAHCILPYPSNQLTVPAATETGLRVQYSPNAFPQPIGPAPDPTPYNELDGFSPTAQILMHFPAGVDLVASGAPILQAPECCGQPAGPPWIDTRTSTDRSLERNSWGLPLSPTLLIDAETGELVRHFVELDARADGNPARQSLIMRPGVALKPAHRYIVAVRKLLDPLGDPVGAEPPFAVLRDGRETTIAELEDRRSRYWHDIFFPLLFAGVPSWQLVLAFDFTTQSDAQLTRQMLAMRDQAFDWLADREAELVPGDDSTETFVVDGVVDNDCSVPGTVLRRVVDGTFESPLFLDDDLLPGSVQYMNVDANDIPVQNPVTPVHNANFKIGIPCTLTDGDPTNDPARPLILGHGLFGTGDSMIDLIPETVGESGFEFPYIAGATDWRGLSNSDLLWVAFQIIGVGSSQLNNFPAFPDRLRQGMLNTLVLARMMKRGMFNNNAAFDIPGVGPVFPGPGEDAYYYGISLGGIMGLYFSGLTPDVERFGVDVPAINFSFLQQRSTQYIAFEALLTGIGVTDPMDQLIGQGLFHDLWVSAEPASVVRHITSDPLPGSGGPSKILMSVAWLDKQVSNQATEVAARTLGIPNLTSSIQQQLGGIPDVDTDVSGPQDSAMVIWDTGSFDILDPAQVDVIPPLANAIPSSVCDPHRYRPAIPASIEQLLDFLQPGGQIASTCDGLCDAMSPDEISLGFDTPVDDCFPYVP